MTRKLARLSNILDRIGLHDLADDLDGLIESSFMERISRKLPSGVEVFDANDVIGRIGLPPHLVQMMGFSKRNPKMGTPFYRVPSNTFDESIQIEKVKGFHVSPDNVHDINRNFKEGVGVEDVPEGYGYVVSRGAPRSIVDIHEATHARGGKFQTDSYEVSQNLVQTARWMLQYSLSTSELEAWLMEMVSFMYAKPRSTFPMFMSYSYGSIFDRRTLWHPANVIRLILWDEVKSSDNLEDAIKNRGKIIESTKQKFIDGPLGQILDNFSKHLENGKREIADLIWESGEEMGFSDEQIESLISQIGSPSQDQWISTEMEEEISKFEDGVKNTRGETE